MELAEVATVDLRRFLSETDEFDVPAAERLRLLCIVVEGVCARAGLPGWLALERIYDEAVRLAPSDTVVLHSKAISARTVADDSLPGGRIWKAAFSAISAALDEAPDDGELLLEQGLCHYHHGDTVEALESFAVALEKQPGLALAQLYRAHCLHDLSRWLEALDAYERVDLSGFTGHSSWRIDVLREQQAFCALKSGNRERAVNEFQAILDRYEKEPNVAFWAMSASLWAAAEGELADEIGERVRWIHANAGQKLP